MGKGTSLVHCERTDVGRKRSSNQDSLHCLPPSSPAQYRQRGWLFLVADGMGAHAAGERASAIAAERVPLLYAKSAQRSPPLALRRSLEAVNAEIHQSGESAPELHGMGTTCTALVLLPRGALVGHVGDSRAYRIRNGTIDQLSRDHSLVWELEAQNPSGKEHVAGWPPKNIITRSMGPHANVAADLEGPFPVEDGDVYLLASDGLSGQVADEEIGLFVSQLEPKEAADALVALTLVRGAPDNVTLIVAKAGPQEVTEANADDAPWPMSDPDVEPPSGASGKSLPWKPLVGAAASLFAGLCLFQFAGQKAHEAVGAAPSLPQGFWELAAFFGTIALVAVAAALLFWAFLQGISSPESRLKVLVPGARLGQGPYRSYSCAPAPALIEGIIASIETAADTLPPARRTEAGELLQLARRQAAAGSHRDALRGVKRALDLHVQTLRS